MQTFAKHMSVIVYSKLPIYWNIGYLNLFRKPQRILTHINVYHFQMIEPQKMFYLYHFKVIFSHNFISLSSTIFTVYYFLMIESQKMFYLYHFMVIYSHSFISLSCEFWYLIIKFRSKRKLISLCSPYTLMTTIFQQVEKRAAWYIRLSTTKHHLKYAVIYYFWLFVYLHVVCIFVHQIYPSSLIWFYQLWPSDAIWRQRSGTTLPQLMACCLTAPSHYINQCWLITVRYYGVRHSLRANSLGNTQNQFETFLFNITAR